MSRGEGANVTIVQTTFLRLTVGPEPEPPQRLPVASEVVTVYFPEEAEPRYWELVD